LRDQTGIIGGRRQSAGLIVGIPDHERDAALGGASWKRQGQNGQQGKKYRLHSHDLPGPLTPWDAA
jgi:hypothetical protein